MAKTIIMILFAMTLLLLSNGLDVKAEARGTLLEVDRKLKLLNKPAVKSIKSEDGDIIDCVDIHKQPAFDHPALRNHIIQMKPTSNFASETSSTKNESSRLVVSQTWARSGSCPKETIPIRRIQRQDLLRADSLEHFGRDGPRTSSTTYTTNVQRKLLFTSPANHSAAYLYVFYNGGLGAKADINAWSPSIESPLEYTTGQIWLKTFATGNFASIEAGWVVYPKLYGNAQPRLFARWTLDEYQTTGCFDLVCSGFVQTSQKLALGAVVQPVSQKGETLQKFINVRITSDNSSNWWLYFGGEKMGYWPGELFIDNFQYLFWGGDVYSQNVMKTPHTTTAMGSGEFAASRYGNACYIMNMLVFNETYQWAYPEGLDSYSDEPNCYSADTKDLNSKPPTFYFGGPGRNAQCP